MRSPEGPGDGQRPPVVYLVDDDAAVREALGLLLGTVGLRVQACATGAALLACLDPADIGCVLLDLRMPQISGLQVHETLRARQVDLPVLVMTGHATVELCRRAFRQGAVDFLEKPVDGTVLLEAVQRAIHDHSRHREAREAGRRARARLALLTERERDALMGVMAGQTSKQSARQLGLSARTVETYRAGVFQKLEVHSVAELMRTYLGVVGPEGGAGGEQDP